MKRFLICVTLLVLSDLAIPATGIIPVENATKKDWNAASFWYSPWGKSGVHKGIDIFAKRGSAIISSTGGLVVYTGNIKLGGNVVAVLGPKWRIHYYAHLQEINTQPLHWASQGSRIGAVGDSGNAKGKSPHLHYSVYSLIPYPWRFSLQPQGWRKIFFMNPAETFA